MTKGFSNRIYREKGKGNRGGDWRSEPYDRGFFAVNA